MAYDKGSVPLSRKRFFEGLSMRACDGDRTHVDLNFLDMKSEEEFRVFDWMRRGSKPRPSDMKSEEEFRVEDAPQRLASTRNLETWNIVQL